MAPDTLSNAPRDYVTVAELAGELRVSLTLIYGAIHGGEIKDVKRVGKRALRIPRHSADSYIESLNVTPEPS
jgi:excisionase family DNA binding protein